jgi:hypothetical protein
MAAPGRPSSAITEWFLNTPEGIEHGFVLPARPDVARPADVSLRVEMAIGGDFRASLDAETQTVLLAGTAGDAALRYDKLLVYDANRRDVPAHFEVSGGRLAIVVDDRGAAYPLTIDPLLAQTTRLTASDGGADDHFGFTVAISGNTAVVGAPNHDVGADADQGAVYVFTRSGDTWTQQQRLTASPGGAGDLFGTSVDISGNTVIVGASLDDVEGNANQGSAYVFQRSGGTWTQQAKLAADDGAPSAAFGFSVAVGGDTAVVGASLDDAGGNANQGAAYVFVRSGDVWTQLQKLTSPDGAAGDLFGISVALDTETMVIGASGKDDGGAAGAGAAYVFTQIGPTWTAQQKLLPNNSEANDFFGVAVAVSGDTALVGASGEDTGANADKGAAFVFVREDTTWTQQQKLTATRGSAGDNFGLSVAVSGDTAVVGVIGDDLGFADQGSAYLFSRSGTAWSQQPRAFAGSGETDDKFGTSVAISGDTVLVGAAFDDVGSNANQGSASVFVLGQGFVEQDQLTANNGEAGDVFGHAVAISGDTAVVGAPQNSLGGNQSQGSAYVFVREGDLVLTVGAGDVTMIGPEILRALGQP